MTAQTILPANTLASGGYEVANSLRMNPGDDSYLSRTKGTSDSTLKGTYSVWFKLSTAAGGCTFFDNGAGTADRALVYISSNETLKLYSKIGNSAVLNMESDAEFRDVAAWYHLVIAIDTADGTAANRVKVYMNGTRITSWSTETYPSQNDALRFFTSSEVEYVGRNQIDGESTHNGYLAEVVKIDNQQLTPTSFGEFNSDSPTIWQPIDVSGLTFGTNGFYLDFEDSDNLGDDESGNTDDFGETNIAAIDQSTDTCTNNSATWNSLVHFSTSATFSEGNLKVAPTENTSRVYTVSTIAMPTVSGSKWYAEFKYLETNDHALIGILDAKQISFVFHNNSDLDNQNGDTSVGRVTYRSGNGLIKFPSGQSVDSSVTLSNNDIVMIALDSGSGKIWFGVNGTWTNSGDPAADSNGVDFSGQSWWTSGVEDFVFFAGSGNTGGHDDWEANFGSPSFAISSGNADGNGYGNFEFAPPSGYFSLNTKNLAEYG